MFVSDPVNPLLLLFSLLPGAVAFAFGAVLLAKGWGRALGAALISMGLSLSTLVLLTVVGLSLFPFSGLADSPFLLLGVPLCTYLLALGTLLRRVGLWKLDSALFAVGGLAALYGIGGFVLMQAACSIHSGGC